MAMATTPPTSDVPPAAIEDVVRFVVIAKWSLVIGIMLGALAGLGLGLVLPKKYRADAVLVVVTPNEGREGALGQVGALAALVGLEMGSTTSRGETIETLRSQKVVRTFIEQERVLPQLFPAEWNAGTDSWRSTHSGEQPTIEQGVRKLRERVLDVSEDKRSGTVTVSVTWRDREVAARWASTIVDIADEELRRRAVQDAERSVAYLDAEAKKASVVELRESMYRLIDNHMRTIVIAKTRRDFALRTIDPAVPPDADDPVSPRRAVLVIIGAMLGLLAGALVPVARRAHTSTGGRRTA